MSNPLVSVVIPTFNRRQSLGKVISPLLDDLTTGEIVVVVDGSTDDTLDFLTEWSILEPRIRVVFQENSGAERARRTGVLESRFDLVLLMDDDVEAGPRLVTGHAKLHLGREHLVVLGYMPVALPSRRVRGQAATIIYAQEYEATCKIYEKEPALIFRHMWAGNTSIRREDALTLGDENEVRIDFHEDLRFGLQCESAGLTAHFDRSLASRHWHQRTLHKFAVDAGRSGIARAELISEYPDLDETLNPIFGNLSRGELIARYLSLPWVRPLASPVAMSLSYLSGRLGAWRLESALALLLRRVEMAYSFRRSSKVVARRRAVRN